ncbi:hypothetical protein H2198_007030 [Neophaeococcomyces mojaviensis]|uniref:Uncharacterized protein n=1 Tax=Neophaeococcomyces mojaviensis TaxID=3383035 RepID=A0ACC3A1R3_9EURO|nr:hypothetical protein H2198_007030 [Knufia sp. JES_112]
MACNILMRLFRRRRRLPDASFQAPALPVPKLDKTSNHISLAELACQEDADFFFLGCLSEQGSYSLTVSDIPNTTDITDLSLDLKNLSGFTGLSWNEDKPGKIDAIVDFTTAAEAAMALATHPTFDLGNGVRRTFQYADVEASEPSRKKMRTAEDRESVPLPRCQICCEELEGPYVKPCFFCKSAWCYDCLKSDFTAVLGDPERFPARCCGKVKHYDMARGIVPTSEYAKYRTRFEEFNTTKPIYCANPICSAFLPPRLAGPDERGQIHCPECKETTCKDCRMVVDAFEKDGHKCAESKDITELLKKFDYKRCPRCNTGVAKMFGCSHVRCQCGAQFCWDCLRPIQMCWSRPCERSREDGNETDPYNDPEPEPESDGEDTATVQPADGETAEQAASTTEPSAVTPEEGVASIQTANLTEVTTQEVPADVTDAIPSTTPPDFAEQVAILSDLYDAATHIAEPTYFETPADAPPHTPIVEPAATPQLVEEITNLDGSDQDDWEGGDYDFGDEPIDVSWNTWGCLHNFSPVFTSACKGWLPVSTSASVPSTVVERHVDCLRCYKTVVLEELLEKEKEKEKEADEEKRKDSACSLTLPPTGTVGFSTHEQPSAPDTGIAVTNTIYKAKKVRKQKKPGEIPKLFNCLKCGVFYCPDCKKATAKEIAIELERKIRV